MPHDTAATETKSAENRPDRADEKAVIAELYSFQRQIGGGKMSDAKFCEKHTTFTESMWSRLKSGTYQADDWTAAVEKCRMAIAGIKMHLAFKSNASEMVNFSFIRDLMIGVREARKQERDRLVALLLETGGGKTCSAKFLRADPDFGGMLAHVEARESHRHGYLPFIQCVAEVINVAVLDETSAMESAVLADLAKTPRVIFVDEAHHLGQRPLNFLKLVLNRTKCVIVLGAIPALWDRLTQKAFAEARQLTSRTIAKIRVQGMAVADALAFCELRVVRWDELSKAEHKTIAERMILACEKCGLWDSAQLFTTFLNGAAAKELPTAEHAESAANDVGVLR